MFIKLLNRKQVVLNIKLKITTNFGTEREGARMKKKRDNKLTLVNAFHIFLHIRKIENVFLLCVFYFFRIRNNYILSFKLNVKT